MGRKSLIAAYGDIIFKCWKRSEGILHETLGVKFVILFTYVAVSCIEDVMTNAILSEDEQVAASCRKILHVFHENKKLSSVQPHVCRSYSCRSTTFCIQFTLRLCGSTSACRIRKFGDKLLWFLLIRFQFRIRLHLILKLTLSCNAK